MLISSSSHLNDSLLFALNSSTKFLHIECFISYLNIFTFNTFNVTKILLLLPICIVILCHGLQRWWRHPSTPAMSHFDNFTYHLATVEMIGVLGCFLNFHSNYTDQTDVLYAGLLLTAFTFYGEVFFHILTCVERYVAVVHPIAYMKMRNERGIRIRNVITGFAWLLSFAGTCFYMDDGVILIITTNFLVLILTLIIVSFCSLSVLWVLTRPGPGKQGGSRDRVDQSKKRAFYTTAAILGVLMLYFVWDIVWVALYISGKDITCVLVICSFWFSVPSSLVLPVLYILTKKKLQRKLICYDLRRD